MWRGNKFLQDFTKLSAGSFVGKLIPLVALPILTRLYTPESFGLLASYLAIVSTLAIIASLRMDVAIPLVVDDDEAANLLALSLLIVIALTASLAIVVTIVGLAFPSSGSPLLDYVWLVPIGFVIAGLYSPLQYWSTRNRRFWEVSWTRVSQSVIGTSVSLLLGLLAFVPIGLLIGNILNIGSGSLRLGISALANDKSRLPAISVANIKKTFRANIKYPKLSAPGALLNTGGMQFPILMIATTSIGSAGVLFVAMQIMFAPLKVIGAPLSQTFMSRGPEKLADGTLQSFAFTVMKNSALSFAVPLVVVGLALYLLAAQLFGAQWGGLGMIALWMLPWAIVQSITSPISTVAYMVGWQGRLLLLRILSFVLRVGGTLLAIMFLADNYVPIVFCLLNFITYSMMLAFFIAAAGGNQGRAIE